MITLYTLGSLSPNIRKVTIMLEETALPYTVHVLEKHSGHTIAAEFNRINPNATVPAIVDSDTGSTLFESGAILYYLAEKSGQLLPTELPRRAEVMKWLMFESANMGPVMGELFHYVLDDEALAAKHLQRYKNRIAQYCTILDQQLAGREYLGHDYSIADIALYPWMAILSDMADVELNDFTNLKRWSTTLGKRSALQLESAGCE